MTKTQIQEIYTDTRKEIQIVPNSPFSHPHVYVCTATCHRPKTMVWSLAQCSVLDTTLGLAWGISDLHIVHTHMNYCLKT